MNDNENSKEVLVAKNLLSTDADKLRSMLVKTVKHVWVLVKINKDDTRNVFIANEWCGTPSEVQKNLAMAIAEGLAADREPITLRDDEFVEVTSEQLVS